MKLKLFGRGSQWAPTVLVLIVVALAGGRLITLSVQQRAEQMRETAQQRVAQYSRFIETQLRTLASDAAKNDARPELDQLLSRLPLSRVIDPEYDFALSKVDVSGGPPRVFVSSRIDALDDGVANVIRVPAGFSQDLPTGYLELSVRPKSGWYPARDLALAVGLLASVAWLLAFATHDLVHSLHRARDAVAHSRRQLQVTNRKLAAEMEQREKLEQSFEHSRYHDAFTGLPNRRYFMDQLDRALRELRTRRRHRIAVLLINIDRFKLINDTLGHTAGDELVVQAARRFQKAAAPFEGVLARWGGDQFAVLMLNVESADAALDIAALLQRELQQPVEIRRLRLSAAARVGVTCVESGLQRAEEVVREADIALSVAKRHETANAVAYQPAMGGSFASLVSLEADLHVAVERRELYLLFQPIIDLRKQRAVGVEALLRWRHPVEGMLTPEKFLAVAEEVGLIPAITRWTIRRVCQVASEWRQRLPPEKEFYISMNLSGAALQDRELSAYVARALKAFGTPASLVKFELTEGGLINDPVAARAVLDALHELGVEMMLDDFGTGYSSLSYLQLFPFDYVKIDRPFVDRPGSERTNSAVAAAIVQMASGLGLKSIAEIVETHAAAQDLQRMGCDYAQGYYYCEPLEAEDALHVLHTYDFSTHRARTDAAASKQAEQDGSVVDESKQLAEDTLMLPLELVRKGLKGERG
jgi:diguanylate cyclase (GGDEF)-like protein